jgi:hypothetical protein
LSPTVTPAVRTAVRRGIVWVALGLLCLLLSWPAIEDLDPLLKGLGAILLGLGLVIIVATARTLRAEEKRVGVRPQR